MNDPVLRYLPFFKVEYPSKVSKQITILNLLNHSSGLSDPSELIFIRWIHHDGAGLYGSNTIKTGLIGSVEDAAKLVSAYLKGGELNGQRIITKESIAIMTNEGQIKAKNEDSLNYHRQGLCWQIYGKDGRWVLTHDGGGPGFRTKIQLYPDENLGFVLFANDDTFETWKIINLAATLKW